MLRLYDFQCKECKQIVEQLLDDPACPEPCPVCKGDMERVFTAMNFQLLYDPKKHMTSWGNEGYQHSQFWDAVKEQRFQGKKVKGAHEQ